MLSVGPVEYDSHVPLAPKTTLGVGGNAEQFLLAASVQSVTDAVSRADARGMPVHVLGGGSNVVVSDEGVPGLVVEIGTQGIEWVAQGQHVLANVQAGENWDGFARIAVEKNLAGVECLSGIPGRVGATPIQNVGAYGQDVSETIENVRCWDRRESEVVDLSRRECEFAYRASRFKTREPNRYVVLSVTFRLARGGAPGLRYAELQRALGEASTSATLQQVRDAVLGLRRGKSMVVDPDDPLSRSCGSFFVNPVVSEAKAESIAAGATDADGMPRYPQADGSVKLSAGWLIERAGFARGTQLGAAQVSDKHALALVAGAGATTHDVLALAVKVRDAVQARFDIQLVAEPVMWGFSELRGGLPQSQGDPTQP